MQMNIANQSAAFRQAVEEAEACYWSAYYQPNVLPGYTQRIADGLAVALPTVDVLAMNRVIGLGLQQPLTAKNLQIIIDFYRTAGSRRFFVQLHPSVEDEAAKELLHTNGFHPYNHWAKLIGPLQGSLISTDCSLSIREVDQEQADVFGQIIHLSFDWEDSRLSEWFAASVGQADFRHYLVYKNHKAIAAGALYLSDKLAALAIAGTLPAYRGLGAQQCLIRHRMQIAQRLGCTHIIGETAEDRPDRPVGSYRNMVRCGLSQAYLRPNWLYTF